MKLAYTLLACFFVLPATAFTQDQSDSVTLSQNQLKQIKTKAIDSANKVRPSDSLARFGKIASVENKRPMMFGFHMGGQTNRLSAINNRLATYDLGRLEPLMIGGGFTIGYRINKLIVIGGDASYMVSVSKRENTTSVEYYRAFLATSIIIKNKATITPEIGVGFQEIRARINTKDMGTNFDSYLNGSANKVVLSQLSSVADLSVMVKGNTKRKAMIPGVRVGYRYGLDGGDWEVLDGTSTDAPRNRVGTFYMQLVFGSYR